MKYCQRCVLPDTRPGINIGEDGICSGCLAHEQKGKIDWVKREKDFAELVEQVKFQSKSYDCIIPVSGGKDSTWQVVKCKDYGMKILAVTWRTPGRTLIGQHNLDNLIKLGVDHIDYSIDPRIESQFTYKTLVKTGSTAVPMHMALYAIPLRIAVNFNIPLVVWGENSFMEYGGTEEERKELDKLDHKWLERHGILQGTNTDDWVDADLTVKDLLPYYLPDEHDFKKSAIRSIFLGSYFEWDPEESLRVALQNGFQVRTEGPKVGYYNYADIDCDFISVHHWFKWLKFGFTRLFDNLSLEIRNGRMTRPRALEIITEMGDQKPEEDIKKLCSFLNISLGHYNDIEEKFRNHEIWSFQNGKWMINDFIISGWDWK